ncbi:hypothetical protein MKW94_006383 [Papaver nudicaule]|uniref:Bidirectional sugar transporter SWEET n=1 Tax=Papaver nudicaule TaxID=74823 RepID=A0AA41VIY0_PAPNU|nr:hypothetical protein [Papaver nudicaule]
MVNTGVVRTYATIRTSAGIMGNVVSLGWFLSPKPTFYSMYKKDVVEDLSVDAYLISIFNCALWVYYGIAQHNNLPFVIMNGIGLAVGFMYVAMYLIYANQEQRTSVRGKSTFGLVLYLVIVIMITPFLYSKLSWRHGAIDTLGYICITSDVYTILPSYMLVRVYETKSLEHMPFWSSLFTFLSGACWLTYVMFGMDYNAIGYASTVTCCLGMVQLIVYAYYYLRYPQSKVAGGELQIPNVV